MPRLWHLCRCMYEDRVFCAMAGFGRKPAFRHIVGEWQECPNCGLPVSTICCHLAAFAPILKADIKRSCLTGRGWPLPEWRLGCWRLGKAAVTDERGHRAAAGSPQLGPVAIIAVPSNPDRKGPRRRSGSDAVHRASPVSLQPARDCRGGSYGFVDPQLPRTRRNGGPDGGADHDPDRTPL